VRRALAAATAVGAATFGALAGPAGAATFGSPDMTQPLSATTPCTGYPCGLVDLVHSDGSDETGAPIDGILTAVRIRYAGNGAGAVFRVLRPSGSDSFLDAGPDLAKSLPATPAAGATLSFPARQPIQAGDRLGLGADTSFSGDSYVATGAPRQCLRLQGVHTVGTSQSYSSSPCDAEVLLQGVVEPDADADGYGDLTQDGCPSDPAIHASACSADLSLSASVAPPLLAISETATFTMTVTNLGTSPSEGVGLVVPVSSAQLVSASSSVGQCGGVRAVFCYLGTLRSGDSATVAVTVRPGNAGRLTLRSSTVSSTSDPDAGNNSASVATTVYDPFAGVALPQLTASVRGGIARVLHGCPSNAARFCEGAATLAQAAPVRRGAAGTPAVPPSSGPQLGRGSFRLQPGAVSTIGVRLTSKTARTLAKRRRMAVVVKALAVDGAGTSRTTYARMTLVQKGRTGRH
jgi:hypothetical protein